MKDHPELEEALRLAEIGEYLYNRSYSYGNGQTEPREYGIHWQWQQSKPDEFGQGVLLAEAVKWHAEMNEDGETEATKLRTEIDRLRTIEAACKRLAYIVRKSVNSGPLSVDPTQEAEAWRQLRVALGEGYDEHGDLVPIGEGK